MDIASLRPHVFAILRESDLATVSNKRVRKALEERLGRDLRNDKPVVDPIIRRCFEEFTAAAEEEASSSEGEPLQASATPIKRERTVKQGVKPERPRLTSHDADEAYARELDRVLNGGRPSRSTTSPKKPKRKRQRVVSRRQVGEEEDGEEGDGSRAKRAPTKNGFNKMLTLSGPLAALTGQAFLSRPQVAKAVWAYIKQHNLQDKADKRYINCDSPLAQLLGTTRVHMFTMTKLLQPHMVDDGAAPYAYAGEDNEGDAAGEGGVREDDIDDALPPLVKPDGEIVKVVKSDGGDVKHVPGELPTVVEL
ncbi:hypothetical protein PYCC9005_004890 [Savitreella phatthalungensis]